VSVGEAIVGIGNAGGTGGTPAPPPARSPPQPVDHRQRRGGNSEQLSGLIESNADIQPGDSGGPLANSSDQVVGMDTAAASTNGSAGVATGAAQSYSIPINTALTLAKQIVASDAPRPCTSAGPASSHRGQRHRPEQQRSGGSAGGFAAWWLLGGSGSGSTSAPAGPPSWHRLGLPGGCRRARPR